MSQSNRYLSKIAAVLRRGRPLYPPDRFATVYSEVVGGRPFVRLWFLTRGCTYDRRGLCTMCNYGRGTQLDVAAVVAAVSQQLAALGDTGGTLLLSPSGSMFDELEVPPELRRTLFSLAAASRFDTVLTESRPETVSAGALKETLGILRGKNLSLEMGLESSDAWVSKWCINKGLQRSRVIESLAITHALGVRSTLNVSLGTAFLAPSEAIEDATRTARWALAAGATDVVLFPLLVREWTVLAYLYRTGSYAPTSLWSLVEVLRRLGPESASRVSIAWYRDYAAAEGRNASSMAVLAWPSSCPQCLDQVLGMLDTYRDSNAFDAVLELGEMECPCRAQWLDTVQTAPEGSIRCRVATGYESLGRSVFGDAWWEAHGAAVVAGIPEPDTHLGGGDDGSRAR